MPHKLRAARDLFGLGVTAAELLVDEEHIGKTIGRGSEKSCARGGQSVAWPTDALVELLASVIDIAEPCGEPDEAEVIVLRDGEQKKQIDYEDTGEMQAMKHPLGEERPRLAEWRERGW